jgi:hypothetical protein
MHQDPAHDTVQGNGAGYEPSDGTAINAALHRAPVSVSAMGLVPPAMATLPTATHVVEPEHDTPDNDALDPPRGLGAVEAVHVDPASLSTRGK